MASLSILPFIAGMAFYSAGAAIAQTPCTKTQMKMSDAYYEADGSKKLGVGVTPPKFCPKGNASVYLSACDKSGYPQAAKFVYENIETIDRLLKTVETVYETYESSFLPEHYRRGEALVDSDKPWNAGSSTYRYPAANHRYGIAAPGGGSILPADEIRLPAPNATMVYEGQASGIVFGLTFRPANSGRKNNSLIVTFKGTEMLSGSEWKDNLLQEIGFFEGRYREAIEISDQVEALLVALGMAENTTVIYTGHSLGGGLSLFAGLTKKPRSNRRRDFIVVFNPAVPESSNRTRVRLANNGITLVAEFTVKGEAISAIKPFKSDFFRGISGQSQVVRFASLDSRALARVGGPLIPCCRYLLPLLNHRVIEIRKSVDELQRDIRGGQYSVAVQDRICRWYTPL